MSTLPLRFLARALTPVIIGFSVYLLLRGHDAAGGGFIGALVASAAVVLQFMARGPAGVRRALPVGFETLVGIGLLTAVGFGVGGLALGGEFLQGAVWRWSVPVLGEVKLAASLLFDVGVFFVVLAVVVAIIRHLGEEPR